MPKTYPVSREQDIDATSWWGSGKVLEKTYEVENILISIFIKYNQPQSRFPEIYSGFFLSRFHMQSLFHMQILFLYLNYSKTS